MRDRLVRCDAPRRLVLGLGLAVLGVLAMGSAASARGTAPVRGPGAQDTACTNSALQRFGYWEGEWVVKDARGTVIGTNSVTRALGGCAYHEHWASRKGELGESFTTYDRLADTWHELYIGSGGYVLALKGAFVGDTLVLTTSPRPATAIGFEVDLPRVGREVFTSAMKRGPLLASMKARDTMQGVLLAIRVVTGPGETYLARGELPADTALIARFSRESDLGAYRVDVGAPLDHLPALARGDGQRLIITYLAFGASVLLVGLAIVQARREQALTRLREAFVAGVSHELRTPLAQIRLYAELLQHGFVRNVAERDDAVRVIAQESARLTHLIENVLAYSRGSAVSGRSRCGPVVVSDVLEQVRQSMGGLASAAGIGLVATAAPEAIAQSDAALLAQILVNYVDNAIRHGVGGSAIRLGAVRRDTRVLITVDDQGPGIPPHERTRVWERFVRLEERTPSPGNGIGLAVAAALVERLGGSTWIEDAPGGGARFVVQLPAVADAPSAAPSIDPVA